ncbi:MAG: hypothetical protein LH645_03480 [Actinomycetia bacterium]|nr:hypothetical protein [Actinomycetes bacterium]
MLGREASALDIAEFAQRIYAQPTELDMVWEAGDGRAVAVWGPPGVQVVDSSLAQGIGRRFEEPNVSHHDVPNHEETWTWIESFVPGDAWYLEVLGVDPGAHGTGLGGALIRHGSAWQP